MNDPTTAAGRLRKRIGLALVALLFPLLVQAVPRDGDYIVAIVNNEVVTAVEVEQRSDQLRKQDPQSTDAQIHARALDQLIEERVIVTYARDSGAKVDGPELERAVSSIAAQNKLTLPQLRDRLKVEGVDYRRFQDNVRDQLMVERVRENEVQGRIRIGDDEVENQLERLRSDAQSDVQFDIAQILVSVPEGADAATLAQRQARIDEAYARLRAGEPFAKVAMDMSEDGNRKDGGEIGLRPAKRLPDEFVAAVRDLAVGRYAERPIRTAAGLHILKLVERSESAAFKSVQTHARHILLRVSERAPLELVVQRMQEIRQQITSGKRQFEAIARQESEDGSAPGGGDLGWVSSGAFVPEFEDAMNKLAINEVSQPVVTRFGVHLIQVLERRETALSAKEVREMVRNQLREQKFDQAYVDWTKDLRARAYVELRDPPPQ